MTGIELLAPLRIETRFRPPDVASGQPNWVMCLRVFPDEFSIARPPPLPSTEEFDRLDQYLAAPFQKATVDKSAAFRTLAGALGAPRAVWLLRTIATEQTDPDRPPVADRSTPHTRDPKAWPVPHLPSLPPILQVWTTPAGGGPPSLAASMTVDRLAVASDLRLKAFDDSASLRGGDLPVTWWTSFERAKQVGLGVEITLGPGVPDFEALFVVGIGDSDPSPLVMAHANAGRLAVLAPGTPTNTVAGGVTTELGNDPDMWFPLVDANPAAQPAAMDVYDVLTGAGTAPFPLQGGDLSQGRVGLVLVTALWPVLWSRAIRDVAGAGKVEESIAEWAMEFLAPEGAHPAVRVGEQPYGLLPATSLLRWVPEAGDPQAEQVIIGWASGWRAMAASAAEPGGTVADATTETLLAKLGQHAPTLDWGARFVMPLALARAWRAWHGMPQVDETPWDDMTAEALVGIPSPLQPVSPVSALQPLPARAFDKPDVIERLAESSPTDLVEGKFPLGILGHLVRESLLIARARAGLAYASYSAGTPIDPAAMVALWPGAAADDLVDLAMAGHDTAVSAIESSGDAEGRVIARRLRRTQKAVSELAHLLEMQPEPVYAALLAALDTASFRVDPWIIGLAERRRRDMAGRRAPLRLGAYGWVDRPFPYAPGTGNTLPPGPTDAGLLHAPSPTQALTAALLRDAAIRMPGDDRWNITIDSSKVRSASRIAERVRLGVHPYEALGLEVERRAGAWDTVRVLRQAFPYRDGTDERQTCDGARALRAILHGAEPLPAGLPSDLASRLRPVDDVLDTYADLLVADGVQALVSGRADLANAAMEAAAGLGAPPELRAIRTPRNATTIRVSAWALVPGAEAAAGSGASVIADPALASLIDDEVGAPAQWTWTVTNLAGSTIVSLADRGLRGVEVLDLSTSALAATLQRTIPGPVDVVSNGGAERCESARRLADLLGGGDANPPVPSTGTSRDDASASESADPLRAAILTDLSARLASLIAAAGDLITAIDVADPGDPTVLATVFAASARWRIEPADDTIPAADRLQSVRTAAAARITAAANVPATVNALRAAIRTLCGNTRLPILPRVPASLLPPLTPVGTDAHGRPETDRTWLEIVAAVHPRLALLEARQLNVSLPVWPAAMSTSASGDPWIHPGHLDQTDSPQVVVAYGPAVPGAGNVASSNTVAIAGLDAWVDSIPSSTHATSAAFGFNGPKSRAPQAIILAVPPDTSHRITSDELLDIVRETRQLVRARAARPDNTRQFRVATPSALARATEPAGFLDGWETP
jgi:hypothetical protein